MLLYFYFGYLSTVLIDLSEKYFDIFRPFKAYISNLQKVFKYCIISFSYFKGDLFMAIFTYEYKREAENGFSETTCPFMIEKDKNNKNSMCKRGYDYPLHIPFLLL